MHSWTEFSVWEHAESDDYLGFKSTRPCASFKTFIQKAWM